MERAAGLGARGGMVSGRPINGIPYGDPYYYPLWAQASGVPHTLSPCTSWATPEHLGYDMYPDTSPKIAWWGFVTLGLEVIIGLTTLFQGAVFERFPDLRIVVLEAGSGWLPYWLDRMDEYTELFTYATSLSMKPTEYFKRQCWISFEPSEEMMPETMDFIGVDKFMWAAAYPPHRLRRRPRPSPNEKCSLPSPRKTDGKSSATPPSNSMAFIILSPSTRPFYESGFIAPGSYIALALGAGGIRSS